MPTNLSSNQSPKKSILFSLAALALMAGAATASAAPQEPVTFLDFEAEAALNNANNDVRTHTFVGGYSPKSIRISGSYQNTNGVNEFRSEARFFVTPPSGAAFEIQTTLQGDMTAVVGEPTTVYSTNDLVLPIPTPISDAAGQWTFRCYETVIDNATGPDGVWTTITFTLDDALPDGLITLTPSAGVYTETEPNDNTFPNNATIANPNVGTTSTFGGANMVPGLAVSESITGTTTGTALTTPGGTSVDNFMLNLATDVPGIYRYQMTLTTAGTAGHTCTIRGLTQNTDAGVGQNGAIISATDTTLQTHVLSGTSRVNQWYGFGKGERVHYRVAGTASTTSAYTSVLSRTTVTPIAITGTISAGTCVFSRASGNTATIDMILFDSNLNPILNSNHHSMTTGTMSRVLDNGTYFLAVSNANTSNSLSSPGDSTVRTNSVPTLPSHVVNTSTTTAANMNVQIVSPGGTVVSVGGAKAAAFDVVWYTFTVAPPTVPTGVATFSPNSAAQGCDSLLSIAVTPAPDLPNNNVVSVTADLSTINGSLPNNFALTDGGSGTWSGTVSVPGNSTTGAKVVTVTMTDADGRVGTANAALTVNAYLGASGSAVPNTLANGGSTLLTVNVTQAAGTCAASTNLIVTGDLTAIGGSNAQVFTDAGGGSYTFNATVSSTDGAKTLPITVTDAEGRTAATSIALTIGYCVASHATVDCVGADEFISNVTIGTINNSSGCVVTPAYEDYTAQSTAVNPDTSVPITVTVSNWFSATDRVSVFCDWNQNLVLDEPGEVTVLTDGGAPNHIYAGNIIVPVGATIGDTRMRVRLAFAVPTACGTSGTGFGNIEDYTLEVSASTNPIVTNPLAVPSSGNIGSATQLTANVALADPPFPIASVTVDLTGINGPASVAMFDDGNHGDGGPNDGLWGVLATVQAGATPGPKLLSVTATDTNGGLGTNNIAFAVCGGFPEPFDGIAGLPACWVSVNNSPAGPGTNPNWNQTDGGATFPPHTGTGYVAANFNSTIGTNDISNYLMSPVITGMENGHRIKFWTRCPVHTAPNFWPDRVSVLISTNGESIAPADFQANPALLVINPTLAAGGYPEAWTEFDVEITGLTGSATGRIAFWYNVTAGGPTGLNSDYVGIDDVEYIVVVPSCTCYGDLNSDSIVDGSDIASFTACVTGGGGSCDCANMDHAGAADADDVDEFVTSLLAGACGP